MLSNSSKATPQRRQQPATVATLAALASLAALSACGPDLVVKGKVKGSADAVAGGDSFSAALGCKNAAGAALPDLTPCDDQRACTVGDHCKAGVCAAGDDICPCEPGIRPCPATPPGEVANLCRGPQICVAQAAGAPAPFACAANAALHRTCDALADTTCLLAACAPLTGACTLTAVERTVAVCDLPDASCRREVLPAAAPDAAPTACDDGRACTTADACAGGTCKAADDACACATDADCVDDDNHCNGSPFCDRSGPIWACVTNPATVINCGTDADNACQKTQCDPATGSCVQGDKAFGIPCNDGLACTVGDVCDGDGACTPGTWTCCKTDQDCAVEEDGDACNGTLFCNLAAGACELNPATVVTCPTVDDGACQLTGCVPATGACVLQPANEGKACDDGQVCTAGEVCSKGACTKGKDLCSCNVDADCASKDDGDLCNGTLYCNVALGQCKPNPATVVTCQTVGDTTCAKTVCTPKTGVCAKVPAKATQSCDADGTACTSGDHCDGKGGCVAGTTICPCLNDSDCAASEDGDFCNGTLYCDKTGAKPACVVNPATLVSCPTVDDTACSKTLCQPKSGVCWKVALDKSATCNDGDPCTGDDRCDGGGGCTAGSKPLCGCKVDADCGSFDDGDVCNGGYACNDESCAGDGKALNCDDGNACTSDSCDTSKGCVHAALTASSGSPAPCDDGNACTTGDACAAGACAGGATIACDDGNDCTGDSCQPGLGCVSANLKAGTSCTSKANGACNAGQCVAAYCPTTHMEVPILDGVVATVACAAITPAWGVGLDAPGNVYQVQKPGGGTDAVVVDSVTKLMWQQGYAVDTLVYAAALSYCDGLVYAGFKDWRLPSLFELESLVDYTKGSPGPTIDTTAFPETPTTQFIALVTTTDVGYRSVSYINGATNYAGDKDQYAVRCVRTP